MINLIEGAGIFIWPLGFCSVMAIFILIERLIALRSSSIIPNSIYDSLVGGSIPESDSSSVCGRLIEFYKKNKPDSDQTKAFAKLEISRMERGLFILEVVVSAAPLIGLLGTVTGLVKVFANVSPETGLPDPGAFIEGTALALTTTMLGISIAIPALIGNSYLNRRVETLSAHIAVAVELLIDISNKEKVK